MKLKNINILFLWNFLFYRTQPTPVKAGVIPRCWVLPHLFSLHTTCQKRGRNIISQHSKKKQYITPFPRPHPLPSLECVTPRSNMITAAHVKYSNCIRYNFFIFCTICMKFSHNILHTYSFISSIIKHNWKIRQFWVVDPLNTESETWTGKTGFHNK